MEHFTRGDLRFDVAERGPADGPAVVLLHGFPQTTACWDEVAPALADRGLRVLAPLQRGYSPGARPPGRRAYALDELVADVLALADAAGTPRFHLVGHDWGAVVAWRLAMVHPERLHTLTALAVPHPGAFAAAAIRGGQLLRSWYMGAFQIPAAPEALLTARGGRLVERALVRSGLPERLAREYAAHLVEPQAATGAVNWYRALPFGISPGQARTPVRVPTVHVWSDGDVALSRAGAQATGRFVDAPYRFEVLSGVSHWIPETAAGTVVELVAALIDRHPG